jgi:lipopolysaccharide exporter
MLSIFYGACIVAGYLASLFTGREHQKPKLAWDRKIFIRFLNYSKFVFGNNFCSLIFRNTDTFMAARYISPIAPAFYSTGTRITNFADMPSQVLGNIMFPRAMEIVKSGNKEEVKRIYEKTVAATLTFIIPIIVFVSVFQEQIILIIAGREYLEAAGILQIMILYALFLPFIRQFGNIMDATGKPQWNFFLMLVFVVLNIVFNFLFIQYFGMPGAAYGTLSSYFLLFITTQLILTRFFRVSLVSIFNNIFILYYDYIKILRSYFIKFFKLNYEK